MTADEFLNLALCNPVSGLVADQIDQLELPDAWIVAGCLTQTVWNVRTGRAIGYGISDYDVFYFDPDTSWSAEDVVIRKLQHGLAKQEVRIEARNQARVHLWYLEKYGRPYPALKSSAQGIDRFLTVCTQAGIQRTRTGHDVYAPKGFNDIADMIVRPNRGPNFSAANYTAKADRWKNLWPEITILPADSA